MGSRVQKVSTPLKGTKGFTVLRGGGGQKVSDTRFSHYVAPPPLPLINDQSLKTSVSVFPHNIDTFENILPVTCPKNTTMRLCRHLHMQHETDIDRILAYFCITSYRKFLIRQAMYSQEIFPHF